MYLNGCNCTLCLSFFLPYPGIGENSDQNLGADCNWSRPAVQAPRVAADESSAPAVAGEVEEAQRLGPLEAPKYPSFNGSFPRQPN